MPPMKMHTDLKYEEVIAYDLYRCIGCLMPGATGFPAAAPGSIPCRRGPFLETILYCSTFFQAI